MTRQPRISPVLRLTHEALYRPNVAGVARVTARRRGQRKGGGSAEELTLPAGPGPFHFSHHMSLLCADIARRIPLFHHVDIERVLVSFVKSRSARLWGLQAKLVPLRFPGGELTERRRGHDYRVQRFFVGDLELRYVLSFYLPRFLNQSFEQKMITIFHELYHIDPRFNGDVRRFQGTDSVHNRSQRDYDRLMARHAREYLCTEPRRILYDFLKLDFPSLQARYGDVVGIHVPSPKLIPVSRLA